MNFSTNIINTEFQKPDIHGSITFPIYRNTAFEFASAEEIEAAFRGEIPAHTYARVSNPTVTNFEQKIQAASGAKSVIALASGMAAISHTFMTIAYAGCNIVASPRLFGNTFSFFKSTLSAFGVEIRFVDTNNLEEISVTAKKRKV